MPIALLDTTDSVPGPLPTSWLTQLAPEEQRRVGELGSQQRVREFVAARVLLQAIAAELLQSGGQVTSVPGAAPVLTLANGEGFTCSVAHSAGLVLVGIMSKGQLGLDVERHRNRSLTPLVERYFWAGGQREFHKLPEGDARLWFYRQWCAREALLKRDGHDNLYWLLGRSWSLSPPGQLWMGQTHKVTVAILSASDEPPPVWQATCRSDGTLAFQPPETGSPLANLVELTRP